MLHLPNKALQSETTVVDLSNETETHQNGPRDECRFETKSRGSSTVLSEKTFPLF